MSADDHDQRSQQGDPCPGAEEDPAADFRAEVREAFGGKNTLSRMADIDRATRRYLRRGGRTYRTSDDEALWVEQGTGLAYLAGTKRMVSRLALLAGAPAGAAEFARAVTGAIGTACLGSSDAPEAQVVKLSALGDDAELYLRMDDTHLLRVSSREVVPNGTAGLVVAGGDGFEPLPELPPPNEVPLAGLQQQLAQLYTVAEQAAGTWLLALLVPYLLLPRAVVRARAVPTLLGEGGSGKTTLVRTLLRLLLGKHAEVVVPPDRYSQRDFQVLIENAAVVGIDDPDPDLEWFAALVRAITTGAANLKRKLYTDKEQSRLAMDAALLLSANSNPLPPTQANVSRLLPLWIEPPGEGHIADGMIEDHIHGMRTQVWSDAIELLQAAQAAGWGEGRAQRRMSRYEGLMLAMAARLDPNDTAWMLQALDQLQRSRMELLIEDDQLAEALVEKVTIWQRTPFQGSASKLLQTLRGTPQAKNRDIAWDGWNPQKIGKRLRDIAEPMRVVHGIHIAQVKRKGSTRAWQITADEPVTSVTCAPLLSTGGVH